MQESNEKLVELIQSGRDDLMLQLWEQCSGWVATMAVRWHNAFDNRRGVELDDLINTGYIALAKAVESYDPSAGGGFITWLTYHLKTAFSYCYGVRTEKGRRDPINNSVSLDAPISADDPDGNTLGDIVGDPYGEQGYHELEDVDYNRALREALEAALDNIDAPCADAIRRRWFDGQTQQEIAESCGVARSMIHNRERRGFSQLRYGKALRILKEFNPYYGTGYSAWRQTGESVQERYVIMLEQYENPNRLGI